MSNIAKQVASAKRTKLRYFLVAFIIIPTILVSFAGRFLIVEEEAVHAEAIVVIGGDHKPQRLQQAAKLYEIGLAPIVIISAGTMVLEGTESLPEAEVMRRQAIALGVPDDVLIIENRSYSTYENARFTKQLLENRGIKSIILVTSAYHSRRARHIFHEVLGMESDITVQSAPPINPPLLWMFYADERQVVQYEYRNWLLYWVDVLTDE